MNRLFAVSSVRCLGCGVVYAKPEGGGTAKSNPGCPKCGYVGWVPDEDKLREELARLRSAADPLPRRFWQSN
jgi:predicted  nucleic acid-binding Zn-ribbon protein